MLGANVPTKELHRELKKKGWQLSRTTGDHDVFTHPEAKHHLSIPRHRQLKAPLVMKVLKAMKVSETRILSFAQFITEAEYQGRDVPLNKPMPGDVKKSKVFVRNAEGNVVKVNFGDKNMTIKKNIPARRRSFRARHNCDDPGPKTKARYWSCKAW